MLSLDINGPKTVKLHLEQQQNALSDFFFPTLLMIDAHLFTFNVVPTFSPTMFTEQLYSFISVLIL